MTYHSQASRLFTIDDTMIICQFQTNMLTDNGYYDTMNKEGESHDRYGATNRILDRRGDRCLVGRKGNLCERLDTQQEVASLQVWASPQGQASRFGEVYRGKQTLGVIPKNDFGPPENGKLNGGP